jgi:hypothetical protein
VIPPEIFSLLLFLNASAKLEPFKTELRAIHAFQHALNARTIQLVVFAGQEQIEIWMQIMYAPVFQDFMMN